MIPIIDTLHALGNFPVANSGEIQCGDFRLDAVLNASAQEIALKANKTYVDTNFALKTSVPTKTSQLTNDSGYLTQHQSLAEYAKKSEIPTNVSALNNDAGYITEHQSLSDYVKTNDSRLTNSRPASDVYDWAKAETKPTYTKFELGLGNVNDTSDADKPISTATQSALDNKATTASVSNLNTRVETTETNISTLSARVDSIEALPAGSTSGDAELSDIRIKADGTSATSAGNAVRDQISEIKTSAVMSTAVIIDDSNVESICQSNAGALKNNKVYALGLLSETTGFPFTSGLIMTYGRSETRYNGDVQIAIRNSGTLYTRNYWNDSWSEWVLVTNETYTKNREEYYMLGTGLNLNNSNSSSICSNNFNNLPNNKFWAVGLTNIIDNAPNKTGAVITYGKNPTRSNGDFQMFVKDSGTIYTRFYWSSTWTNWKLIINEDYIKARENIYVIGSGTNITDSNVNEICSSDFNNLPNNRIYGVGITSAQVSNCPGKLGSIRTIGKTNSRTSSDVQIFTSNTGSVFTRIYWGSSWSQWSTESGKEIRVLALGDSICYGYRNSNKGFIGDAGVAYDNIGISGATLSNKVTDKVNIPTQLENFSGTYPDAIISNGGVNDYYFGATLGSIPTVPVKSQTEADSLDKSTVLGGLQLLFWNMIKKYPKSSRFFLCTHKTTAAASSTSSSIVDWTVTKNSKNYTQTELFDAIKATCKIYGVSVIDVFNESQINTAYSAYKSATAYNTDPTVGATNFVDADGIHPLDYGYKNAYVPLVKQAIDKVTKK